jgi:folate-dependent tRNA-U54 methylase TrmFO/GidA
MNDEKKFDKTVINFVIGGAVLGAIAGYVVKKTGVKNILNILKSKKIISSNIADTITEFTSNNIAEDDE